MTTNLLLIDHRSVNFTSIRIILKTFLKNKIMVIFVVVMRKCLANYPNCCGELKSYSTVVSTGNTICKQMKIAYLKKLFIIQFLFQKVSITFQQMMSLKSATFDIQLWMVLTFLHCEHQDNFVDQQTTASSLLSSHLRMYN